MFMQKLTNAHTLIHIIRRVTHIPTNWRVLVSETTEYPYNPSSHSLLVRCLLLNAPVGRLCVIVIVGECVSFTQQEIESAGGSVDKRITSICKHSINLFALELIAITWIVLHIIMNINEESVRASSGSAN